MSTIDTNDNAASAPAPADEGIAHCPAGWPYGNGKDEAPIEATAGTAAVLEPAPAPALDKKKWRHKAMELVDAYGTALLRNDTDGAERNALLEHLSLVVNEPAPSVPEIPPGMAMVMLRRAEGDPNQLEWSVTLGYDDADKGPSMSNVAHFMGDYLQRNLGAISALAVLEWNELAKTKQENANLRHELRRYEERTAIKLVGADGHPLDGGPV